MDELQRMSYNSHAPPLAHKKNIYINAVNLAKNTQSTLFYSDYSNAIIKIEHLLIFTADLDTVPE